MSSVNPSAGPNTYPDDRIPNEGVLYTLEPNIMRMSQMETMLRASRAPATSLLDRLRGAERRTNQEENLGARQILAHRQ